MKRICCLFVLGLLLIQPTVSSAALQDPARIFLAAVNSYEQGHYAAAAEGFLTLAEAGVVNGNLYYNIANAFFKAGDIGRAVLWYEKAYRLIPRDPDLKFNLAYARTLVKDKAPDNTSWLLDLFFWRYWLGRNLTAVLAAVFSVCFFFALFLKRKLKKGVPGVIVYGTLGLFLFFSLTATGNYLLGYSDNQGVVLAESISVKSGLSDLATELFVLHAGSRVAIEQKQKNFYRIRFGKDKIGWVNQKTIGII